MAGGSTIRPRGESTSYLGEQLAALLVSARGQRPRTEMARMAGVAPATLAVLEHPQAQVKRPNPTLAYVERIASLYGVRLRIVVEAEDAP